MGSEVKVTIQRFLIDGFGTEGVTLGPKMALRLASM